MNILLVIETNMTIPSNRLKFISILNSQVPVELIEFLMIKYVTIKSNSSQLHKLMSRNLKLRFKFQFMKLKINSINQYHATSSTTALVVEKLPDSFIEFLCALQHSFNQFINDIDKGTQRRLVLERNNQSERY